MNINESWIFYKMASWLRREGKGACIKNPTGKLTRSCKHKHHIPGQWQWTRTKCGYLYRKYSVHFI